MTAVHDLVAGVISGFIEAEPVAQRAPVSVPDVPAQGPPVRVVPREQYRLSLASALGTRRSTRFFADGTLPADELAAVIEAGRTADRQARAGEPDCCPIEVFVVALRVSGLPPAIYAYRGGAFEPVADLPPADRLSDLTLQTEFAQAAAIVSFAGGIAAADARHGGHGYRLLLTRAGLLAHTTWLESVRHGWVGSVFAGFIPASVRQALRSDVTNRHQLFAFAVGRPHAEAKTPTTRKEVTHP